MALTGIAVLILLVAMAAASIARQLLLRTLRIRHPREFEALGSPSNRQLSSFIPRHREMQIRFWKYLWGGKFFLLNDARLSGLAWAALASDAALVGSVALLFWFARR